MWYIMTLKGKCICHKLETMQHIQAAFHWWIFFYFYFSLIILEYFYCQTWGIVKTDAVLSRFSCLEKTQNYLSSI